MTEYEYRTTVPATMTSADMETRWANADGNHDTIRRDMEDANAVWFASDGCRVNDYDAAGMTPVTFTYEPTPTPETQPDAEPPAPEVDPLDAWEAGLPDADATLDRIWSAADAAADRANACGEYEQTAAWPHGHEGRSHVTVSGDDGMDAGDVTLRRTITRTVTVRQELRVWVEAGDDPYDTAAESYDWEDVDEDVEDERDDYGPEVYEDDREPMRPEFNPSERTQPADLVRAALEGTGNGFPAIRDAILTAAQGEGAPITQAHTVSMSGTVGRYNRERSDYDYASEEHRALPVDAYTARQVEAANEGDRYAYARSILAGADNVSTTMVRIVYPTLTMFTRQAWEASA